jgi:hypothetical protein
MSKLHWNDITNYHQEEVKKKYKLDARGLEQQLRKHLDGANATERRQVYETMYNNKQKS